MSVSSGSVRSPEALDALRRAASHYFDLYDDATAEGDHIGTVRDLYDVYAQLLALHRELSAEGGDGNKEPSVAGRRHPKDSS